jgi:hypothetical protein
MIAAGERGVASATSQSMVFLLIGHLSIRDKQSQICRIED